MVVPQKASDIGVNSPCATLYANTLPGNTAPTDAAMDYLFGGSDAMYFEPTASPVTASNKKAVIKGRMLFQAHILRAASRLLKDLIDKSVAADLAGTEQRRAHETDPRRGAKLAWGIPKNGETPFNTLAAAIRTVAGRWEMSPASNHGDPKCAGVAAYALLPTAYGDAASARYNDLSPSTGAEQRAVQMIDSAGIVIPASQLQSASAADIRAAVLEQLQAQAAAAHGITVGTSDWDDFLAKGQGAAITAAMADVTDGDLRFALDRSFEKYRQLVSGGEAITDVRTPGAALKSASAISPKLAALNATALSGGTPRGDLTADIMARAAGIQVASQCVDANQQNGAVYADHSETFALQDSFATAITLQRRLVVLREEATNGGATAAGEAAEIADEGAAEVRAWSGHGYVAASAKGGSGTTPGSITVKLVGLEPGDFGVRTAEEIPGQVGLVWGEPWVADCAARLRSNCPSNMEDYLVSATSHVTEFSGEGTSVWRRDAGTDGPVISLTFPGSARNFAPQLQLNKPTLRAQNLYLIQKHDPAAPTTRGKVVAALALRKRNQVVEAPVSETQRALFNEIMGVSRGWAVNADLLATPNTSLTPIYCNGIPRGQAVPLESELTSDGDQYESSWKHYLLLAEQSAGRADELGRQLIDIGLQKDMRREAAGEEVAAICGQYGVLDDISFEEGKVVAPDGQEGIASCLDEGKTDIVFLTKDRVNDDTVPAAERTTVSSVLRCGGAADNPLCADPSSVSTGGLGIVDFVEEEPAADGVCAAMRATIGSLTGNGFDSAVFQKYGSESWLESKSLEYLIRTTRIDVGEDGTWKLTSGGSVVMNSAPNANVWPGCRANGSFARCGDDALAKAFDEMYRLPGELEGSTNPTDSGVRDDMQTLLWRVEGSLWMIGAMAGIVPAGSFTHPVLVADYTDDGAKKFPVYTVYGYGLFDSGTDRLSAPDDEFARDALGTSPKVTPDRAWPSVPGEVPPWLIEAGGDSAYRVVQAANSDYALTPNSNNDAFVTNAAKGLSGLKCSTFSGNGDGSSGMDAALVSVSDRKSPEAWRWLCVAPNAGIPTFVIGEDKWTGASLRDRAVLFPSPSTQWNTTISEAIPGFPLAPPDDTVRGDHRIWYGSTLELGVDDPLCGQYDSAQLPKLGASCIRDGVSSGEYLYTHRMLSPRFCGPDKRVKVFINSYPPQGYCGAAAQLAQSIALACQLSVPGAIPPPVTPPPVRAIEDIPAFQRWTAELSKRASIVTSRLYLESVPERVVKDFQDQTVGTGTKDGEHGRIVVQMGTSLRNVQSGWQRVSTNLSGMATAIDALNAELEAADIRHDQDLVNIAIQRIQVHMAMVQAAASAVSAWGYNDLNPVGGLAQSIASAANEGLAVDELGKLGELEALADNARSNQMLQAFIHFEQTVQPLYADTENALRDIQTAVADALSQASLLRQNEAKAQYEAAKGAGQDFVVIDGKVVTFPVNTVLNRQYDITKLRYERALNDAKNMAYIARLAIEQRLGQRLNTITERVGPMDPPAEWADDVCSLQGIDYEALRTNNDATSAADGGVDDTVLAEHEAAVAAEFADQYVGDYVAKLASFVEYYNIDFPSHDGDDTAVLSLRDDLLRASDGCVRESPNLLFYSDQLDANQLVSEDGDSELRGWHVNACGADRSRCLRAAPGASLPQSADGGAEPANLPPQGVLEGGVTWLVETAGPELSESPTSDAVDAGATDAGFTEEPRQVWQEVYLEAGVYVLSWWDQARTTDGQPLWLSDAVTDTPSTLVAGLYDEAGTAVKADLFTPHQPTDAQTWSDRRALEAFVHDAGTYYVAFSVSLPSEQAGSLAIANVQLERTESPGSGAGPYYANESTRSRVTAACQDASEQRIRSAFRYDCESDGGCFYELKEPIVISTAGLGTTASYLTGKLASGNFNFRHITLALNLVGTGVHDCSGQSAPSCYGSGFVEYTMNHDAFHCGVLGWNNEVQYFNFGSGAINHGKALAAERMITMPISSADSALLSQPGIEKTELTGRPLDGSYRLRIWDTPDLHWQQLEDIQLVLRYRYWSAIEDTQ